MAYWPYFAPPYVASSAAGSAQGRAIPTTFSAGALVGWTSDGTSLLSAGGATGKAMPAEPPSAGGCSSSPPGEKA